MKYYYCFNFYYGFICICFLKAIEFIKLYFKWVETCWKYYIEEFKKWEK